MAVVTRAHNDIQVGHRWTPGEPCRMCGERTHAPVFAWACDGPDNLVICGPCVAKNSDGMTADFVHLTAIMKLREIYPDYTLKRECNFFKKDPPQTL